MLFQTARNIALFSIISVSLTLAATSAIASGTGDSALLSRSSPMFADAAVLTPTLLTAASVQDEDATIEEDDPSPWLSEIDFGLGGSTGNTETLDLRAAFRTGRLTETTHFRFDTSYFYGRSDGEKNKSAFTAGVRNDWFVPDTRWLYFAQARFDFDEFKDWEYRASAFGGLGYQFIKEEDLRLIGRLGAGVLREWRENETRPEGLIGLELGWNIDDRQRLAAETTLYPDLGDFFEFRWVTSISWRLAIDRARGLNVSAGIENEYDSHADPGFKKNDLRFYAGLTYAF